jgi:hypothetical protein
VLALGSGKVKLHGAGLGIGGSDQLKSELKNLLSINASKVTLKTMNFIDSVSHFSGGDAEAKPTYMKAKSDYVFSPLSTMGVQTLIESLNQQKPDVVAIFDSYGGAVSRPGNGETAFAHRQGAKFAIQYYSQWAQASQTPKKIQDMRSVYAAMRPYVSGQAYVNYCDLDLENWAQAYWAENLDRLIQIKGQIDPHNIFRHAQSVPLKAF